MSSIRSKRLLAATLFGVAAIAAAGCTFAGPSPGALEGTIIDLSHAYGDDTIYWPTAPAFKITSDFKGTTEAGYHYESNTVTTSEHGGTHLDAPIHFAEGGLHADEIPLDRLIGPAVVIDVTRQSGADRDYQVSVADIEAWEKQHGRLPDGVIVLLRTGYSKYWPDLESYLGTAVRGPEAIPLLHFPGLHPGTAKWLVENRSMHAIGLDTASIDRGQSTLFESHRTLFAANIPAFENVTNLDQLPATGFQVIALPMKIKGGSGGPLRIVAVVPNSSR